MTLRYLSGGAEMEVRSAWDSGGEVSAENLNLEIVSV